CHALPDLPNLEGEPEFGPVEAEVVPRVIAVGPKLLQYSGVDRAHAERCQSQKEQGQHKEHGAPRPTYPARAEPMTYPVSRPTSDRRQHEEPEHDQPPVLVEPSPPGEAE